MEAEVGPDMDSDREREGDSEEDSDAKCSDLWDSEYMDNEVDGKMDELSSDSEDEESEDLVNSGNNFSSGKVSDSERGEQDIVFSPRDKYDPPFELGMLFSTKDEFREYNPKHKCGRSYDVKNVNSKWLSGKYEYAFRNDPKRNAKGFTQDADLGIERPDAFTFVSDKKKGLIPAYGLVFPGAENRFCVRHLHKNFKKAKFRGLTFKLALSNATKATTILEYEFRMKEMGLLDEFAVEWFNDKPPSQWKKNMEKSADCIPLKSDDWNYEIKVCDEDRLTVNLRTHSCSCRRWDLTGIPCSHAMSAIGYQVLEPDDFVHESYSVATYLAVYSHPILLVNGPKLWKKLHSTHASQLWEEDREDN
ncbi:hypothetical protein BUALT_Bualt12G0066600 [Buddleja alternifolia]|uniref:SWIM-type domain-containing protein n=1 Tax=Buddleja alternifolia TaxID=168488 RepID=A0AAV6WVV6_9LAMI|nr:hypothetical protein BUALT_Bualt12G0066600 [Buddleja alternifolia]